VKVGLELIHAAGFGVIDRLREAGCDRIFYDCKLHDIPTTVAGAVRSIVGLGVWMLNVHASGGTRMMVAAVQAARESADAAGVEAPLVLAVTLLTSLDAGELANELRVDCSSVDYVALLARMARETGCSGVVCSPREVGAVRWACGNDFIVVTPGVRPVWADRGDQRRVATPSEAVACGSDYIVVGRPITGGLDPGERADRIAAELRSARVGD
jgi:orotidine-5'-phosphate decarboxylase